MGFNEFKELWAALNQWKVLCMLYNYIYWLLVGYNDQKRTGYKRINTDKKK